MAPTPQRSTLITATILTHNEMRHIGECLDSLESIADEIIVVDSLSTDGTPDICRERGCKVYSRPMAGYGAQRQYATSLATHDYVLAIDADEVLSPRLRQSLKKLKREGFKHRGYSFARLNFYCGQPVRHCGWYPDTQVRLFDRRYANWNLHDVAEKVIFRDGVRPEPVEGDILHYRCDSPEEYSNTEHAHAAIRARVLAESEIPIPPGRPWLEGVRAYLGCLIGKGGIFDGRVGAAIARQHYRSAQLAYSAAAKARRLKR